MALAVWSWALSFSGQLEAGPPLYVGAAEADLEFDRITEADMQVIRGKRVLFASRSFGLNCLSGLNRLVAANPIYALNRSPTVDVSAGGELPDTIFDTFNFVHYLCALQPDYEARLTEFEEFVAGRFAGRLDAVMIPWFALCDAATFAAYEALVDRLRTEHPGIKVICATSGFMVEPVYAEHNVESAEFVALVREAYRGEQPLYDIASLVSTHADGTSVGDRMCPEFNTNGDGVHPDDPFVEERMGRALLLTLYKVFCEAPLRADAGEDGYLMDDDGDGWVEVGLDGSRSYAQEGEISGYRWEAGGEELGAGVTVSVSLPYGTHVIDLYVNDDRGNVDRDEVVVVAKPSAVRAVYQIRAAGDDTLMTSANNAYGRESTYWPYSDGSRRSAMRWAIDIPPGSVVLEARVRVRFCGTQIVQNSPILQLNLIDQDDCGSFGGASNNPFQWPVTSDAVLWTLGSVTWINGEWYETPDLRGIVQEFVDRPGYRPGNHLGLRGVGAGGGYSSKKVCQWDYGDHSSGAILEVLYSESGRNLLPVAAARAAEVVQDHEGAGSVLVGLDGSMSEDPDGEILRYEWWRGSELLAEGATVTVSLPVGLNTIELTVTDDQGATARDTVVVTVVGPDQAGPGLIYRGSELSAGLGTMTIICQGGGGRDLWELDLVRSTANFHVQIARFDDLTDASGFNYTRGTPWDHGLFVFHRRPGVDLSAQFEELYKGPDAYRYRVTLVKTTSGREQWRAETTYVIEPATASGTRFTAACTVENTSGSDQVANGWKANLFNAFMAVNAGGYGYGVGALTTSYEGEAPAFRRHLQGSGGADALWKISDNLIATNPERGAGLPAWGVGEVMSSTAAQGMGLIAGRTFRLLTDFGNNSMAASQFNVGLDPYRTGDVVFQVVPYNWGYPAVWTAGGRYTRNVILEINISSDVVSAPFWVDGNRAETDRVGG